MHLCLQGIWKDYCTEHWNEVEVAHDIPTSIWQKLFFEVFCLGCEEFVRHFWQLGVFWGGVPWPTFRCLNLFYLYCHYFRRAHMRFLFVLICVQGVTVQFFLFFSLTWFPDQITRPPIDLTALLKRKLNEDFKKVGPIRGNPFYKSLCAGFWRDLTQKMPEIYR